MNLYQTILSDLRAKARWCYRDESRRSLVKVCVTDGTAAMILYRLMQWATRCGLTPLAMLFNKLNSICCHCIIGRGAHFGPEFVLIHSNGVVINSAVVGGTGVHVEHQVTIGAEQGKSPSIGNGVFIGAGARIIGPVRVGDNARIGANAVVIADVPANHTAVGVPARLISHQHTQTRAA